MVHRYMVYDAPIFSVWNEEASSSVHCSQIEATILAAAADSPPVNAKWTPEEKNRSI
jgi:hypothetical protein